MCSLQALCTSSEPTLIPLPISKNKGHLCHHYERERKANYLDLAWCPSYLINSLPERHLQESEEDKKNKGKGCQGMLGITAKRGSSVAGAALYS